MDNNKGSEFIFWLDFWRNSSAQWPNLGHFKCVITKEKIHVSSTENARDEEITIDVSSVMNCRPGYIGNGNHNVVLYLEHKNVILGPVHPIDPNGIQNFNHKEASALIKVIESFRVNTNPDISANPYLRQLAEKNNLRGFNVPDTDWDKHTSPWKYYELFGDKFLRAKVFIRNVLQVLIMVVFVTALILGLVYMLAVLRIF